MRKACYKSTMLLTLGRLICALAAFSILNGFASTHAHAQIKVAAVQFPLESGKTEAEFLAKVDAFIDQAHAKNVQLLVFPELHILDLIHFSNPTDEARQLKVIASDFTPRYVEWIKQKAQANHMAIMAGTSPRLENNEVYNTAYLAFADGRVVSQDKLFLTPDEIGWRWKGGSKLNVFESAELGKFAITICFDSEFPTVSNALAAHQPELILIPSMTGKRGFNRVRFSAQARSVEHYAFTVVTGTVSAISKTDTVDVGQAAFIQPQEEGFPEEIKQGPYNKSALVVETLDLSILRQKRETTGYHPAKIQGQHPAIEVSFTDCNALLRGENE